MNTTKHKPNLTAQMAEHEMPEWKGLWANSYGRKLGHQRFNSAKEARTAYLQALPRAIVAGGWKNLDGSVCEANVFVIQIPVSA